VGSLKGTEILVRAKTNTTATIGDVKSLGKVLFTDFLLPFEIASVLLLAAMVGVVMLGKSERNIKL
jgi:NADH-quinone oxidoreductase subunit J